MLGYLSSSGVNLIVLAIAVFTFALKVFALVDVSLRRPEAFPAAGKLTKVIWLAILGVSLLVALAFASPIMILNLAGTVAAIVYLVDVRPAIRGLGGTAGTILGRRPGGGPGSGGRGPGATGW
jgi:hypothetical protein